VCVIGLAGDVREGKMEKQDLKIRYKKNPFLDEMIITPTAKQVKISALGKDDNVLVNQSTGEISGTHITTYKKVDSAEFVKLFAANVALTFDLKAAGIKAFNVLIWAVQYTAINKDEVALDSLALKEFIKTKQLKLSLTVFKRGLNELEQGRIIAKTERMGFYFINPNFVFNGNRIVFSTAIELDGSSEVVGDAHLQQDFIDDASVKP